MSSFKFNRAAFRQAMSDLERGIREAGEEGMNAVMDQAAQDAREIHHWREPGKYIQDYGEVTWEWEVTGMAQASITAYVVPQKKTAKLAPTQTTSYRNGRPLRHISRVDDSVTADHSPDPNRITGIVTMNIAYAPYLQDYERRQGENPVVVEVLETQWAAVYVPSILKPIIQREMSRLAARYT